MTPPRPGTQKARILKVLADGHWHGPNDFGRDFYTCRNRVGELRRDHGYRIESRRVKGERWHEYRLAPKPATADAPESTQRHRTAPPANDGGSALVRRREKGVRASQGILALGASSGG